MYVILGWLNVALVILITSHFWLRFLGRNVFHWHSTRFYHVLKVLRIIHKPLAVLLIANAVIHGLLALGTIRVHTGTLLLFFVILTAFWGTLFFLLRKKPLLAWHKRFVLLVLILLIIHLVFPSAVYYLLT